MPDRLPEIANAILVYTCRVCVPAFVALFNSNFYCFKDLIKNLLVKLEYYIRVIGENSKIDRAPSCQQNIVARGV